MKERVAESEIFSAALKRHAPGFRVQPSAEELKYLSDYYMLLKAWNARLHLVAPCSAEELAVRHVLESMVALPFLKEGARVVDVGSGAGLPIIPCLVMRPDLRATLIEASSKKSVFLSEALRLIEAGGRAKVIARRFEDVPAIEADFVTCRALDRFTEMFERLIDWSPRASTLLFFGGEAIREGIEKAGLGYRPILIPQSERRYLFVIERP